MLDELKKERDAAGSEVREMVRSASDVSDRYRAIRLQFAKLVKDVLFAPAEMFLRANDSGNLEFKADFQNPSKAGDFTSEGEGTTYKKFLCMAFDMAVLQTCSQQRFFHFVYHGGALETEDNRRKNQWLEAVRQACDEHGLQYIMTVLEDDLPRDEHDQKVPFSPTEIIRELHDRGDDGRLFRMPKF